MCADSLTYLAAIELFFFSSSLNGSSEQVERIKLMGFFLMKMPT